jgi:uncharacterized membrane protein
MIDFIYQVLNRFDYTHPIHPIFTHLPIGLVFGVMLLAIAAGLSRRSDLAQSARHCAVLALILLIPALATGIMDWQYYYGGAMLFAFEAKMALAGALLILLILAVAAGRSGKTVSNTLFLLYLCSLLTVIALGYFGGQLVYGSKPFQPAATVSSSDRGAALYQQHCSACHFADRITDKVGPGLKGIFKADTFPSSGNPATEDNFRKLLKNPLDEMPAYDHLSQAEVAALIEYMRTL